LDWKRSIVILKQKINIEKTISSSIRNVPWLSKTTKRRFLDYVSYGLYRTHKVFYVYELTSFGRKIIISIKEFVRAQEADLGILNRELPSSVKDHLNK
jgi:hypothetical protein